MFKFFPGCSRRLPARRVATSLLMAAVIAGCVGCGSDGLPSVSGRVLHQGKPAAGATLHFHRQGAADARFPGVIPSAVADEDGRYWVSSDTLGRGAPAGKYAVLITWPGDPQDRNPKSTAKAGSEINTDFKRSPIDRLQGRYSNVEKPRFSAEVGPGSSEIPPFEIND